MPRLKVLGGKQLIKIFSCFGFEIIDQRGGHVKVRCIYAGNNQTLTIPMHKEIDKGLFKQIYIHASQYISDVELKPFFIGNLNGVFYVNKLLTTNP